MIRDKHEETFDSPSLPPRARRAVTAPSCLSSLGNSLAANILNYLGNMLPGKRESSGEAFAQFKSFNLTACGVMMTCGVRV